MGAAEAPCEDAAPEGQRQAAVRRLRASTSTSTSSAAGPAEDQHQHQLQLLQSQERSRTSRLCGADRAPRQLPTARLHGCARALLQDEQASRLREGTKTRETFHGFLDRHLLCPACEWGKRVQ